MVDQQFVNEITQRFREGMDYEEELDHDELYERIEKLVFEHSQEHPLTAKKIEWLVSRVYNALRGLDVLQPLIDDPAITEIMINKHDEIFIEKNGEVILTDVQFDNAEKLNDIIQAIVSKVNRVINESTPIVDARLEDGSRVNVVLPPVTLKGPTMTIRKFPEKPLLMNDLIQYQALNGLVALFLQELVQAKYNIFIGGGTGSGKTTFLNALSHYIPKHERVITIEDSAELQIQDVPNLVSMETRNPNTEGNGGIGVKELIRTSLRMRPNRIIVGEVRGVEALEMLQAMNTGHEGSLSTGHANSVHDMLSRLETMVLSGAELPVQVVRKQISSAIDIMVHLSRMRDHSRKVVSISEIVGIQDHEIQLNPLYEFVETGEDEQGKIIGDLQPTGNKLKHRRKLGLAGIRMDGQREHKQREEDLLELSKR